MASILHPDRLMPGKLWMALGCTVLLGACATQEPYRAPELGAGPTFRNPAPGASPVAVPPAPQLSAWWRGFDDPQLTVLVEAALNHNLDVEEAVARLDEARALARRAGAARLPGGEIATQASQQRQSLESPIGQFARSAPGFQRDLSVFDGALSASWELDLFGRLRGRTAAAVATADERSALLEGVRIAVAAQTADAYLRLASAGEQLTILDAQLDVQRRLSRIVLLRFDAGDATVGERDEATAQVASLSARRQPLMIERETQINRLYVLTGGKDFTGRTFRNSIPTPPKLIALDTPGNVFRRRPDVQAAERRVAAAYAQIGAALAEYYPSFSLSGLLGLQAVDAANLFTSDAVQASAIFGLRWRLFDFARIDAEVDAARGREGVALADYRRTILMATEEVENALFAAVAREQEAANLRREVADLERARYASQRSYDAGIAPLADLLDIDRRLLAARRDEAGARLSTALASVQVYRAIGAPAVLPDAS